MSREEFGMKTVTTLHKPWFRRVMILTVITLVALSMALIVSAASEGPKPPPIIRGGEVKQPQPIPAIIVLPRDDLPDDDPSPTPEPFHEENQTGDDPHEGAAGGGGNGGGGGIIVLPNQPPTEETPDHTPDYHPDDDDVTEVTPPTPDEIIVLP